MTGGGTIHPTAGDTYTITYTTGGVSFTQTGHF
jgi:endoglucanase